ncbi:MAG: hypothetical protein ACXWID_01710 [Pyrinomonadaceae bacterium]
MAHTDVDNLPAHHLERVQREIGSFINDRSDAPSESVMSGDGPELVETPLNIGETFAIWKLKPEALRTLKDSNLRGDLVDWVKPTSLLYHQLRFNDQQIAFARSTLDESRPQALSQLGGSEFSSLVEDAIGFIDHNEQHDKVAKSDPIVRLLEIPSYQTFLLWLFAGESRVVVIEAPDELSKHSFYTSDELFKALKSIGTLAGVS